MVKKQRSLQRKQYMPFCLQTKDLISEFYTVLKEDVSTEMSNIRIAQLNRLAYQNILQRSLLKKINKRVGENAGMLQQIDQEISSIVSSMDFNVLGEKYKEVREGIGHCLISYRDWLDALQDGDCFCLTFDAQRAQGGIMDPSLVTIKTINTTMLTAESFLDSALFITRAGQIIKGVGVRGELASTLVKGLPDEVITGILPLYINEDHWKVARCRVKPLLAWTVAQDVLAYEPRQLVVLPFLLLAKAACDLSSEHSQKRFKLILDTCTAIYRENKGLILHDIKSKYAAYVTKPEVRTIDSISNNRIFLLHLYVASQAGDIEAQGIPKIFRYVLEEELRRNGPRLDIDRHDFFMKLLVIDVPRYITSYIERFTADLNAGRIHDFSIIGNEFKQLLIAANIPLEQDSKVAGPQRAKGATAGNSALSPGASPQPGSPSEEEAILVDTSTIGERAMKTLNLFNAHFKTPTWTVYQTNALLSLFGAKPFTSVEEMGIDTPAKKLAFVIQLLTQRANADRKEAIKNGTYVDPFDQEAAAALVTRLYREHVILARNVQKSKLISLCEMKSCESSAPLFASTTNIYEAAGIVRGTLRGSFRFQLLYTALQIPNVPLVTEKVHMLVSGQYRGLKLIEDQMRSLPSVDNGFITWKAKKNIAFRIWKNNRTHTTLEQWQNAFPHLAEYFAAQEKRAQGIFVAYRKPKRNVRDKRHWPNGLKPEKHKSTTLYGTRKKK